MLFISIGWSTFAQGKVYEDLYAKFGEIPTSLSSVQLKDMMNSTNSLNDGDIKAMDQMLTSDEVMIPVGKYESGKSTTLLYLIVDTKLKKLTMHSVSISTKTGEIVGLNHYLISIGKETDMAYDGSFKRDGDIMIFTNDEENDGEWKASQTKYKLGKTLTFVENLD